MVQDNNLDYRQLLHCRVEVASNTQPSREAVKLSRACYDAANTSLLDEFDFSFERSILTKKKDVDNSTNQRRNREYLENILVDKLKTITNADDDTCVSILEANDYDLKLSQKCFLET